MSNESFIEDLVDEHHEVIKTEKVPLRFFRWIIVAIICVFTGIFSLGFREDWSQFFIKPSLLLQNFIIITMILLSGFCSLLLSIPGSLSEKNLRRCLRYPVSSWLLSMLFIAVNDGLSLAKATKISLFSCTANIFAIGILPGITLFFLIYQGSVLKRNHAGLLAMLASFGLGAWAVQFTCHNDDPGHIFFWHFLPILVLGFIGTKLGEKLFKKI